MRKNQVSDGPASDADEELSAKEKIKVKSFIHIIDVLKQT